MRNQEEEGSRRFVVRDVVAVGGVMHDGVLGVKVLHLEILVDVEGFELDEGGIAFGE